MDLIVSHTALDFDGFASMLAAQKLYPGAMMAFSGQPQDNFLDFVLFKEILSILMTIN